ncbi:hypothetical protein NQT62_14750 [Limnobacter humi]|uniref:DUF2946 domain-containing protein n=1 Tax=Limnobacter humi TaxID=1778671 RepID=A0ABT1WKR0_9BURK|nr:hypothetical protein [Limnobacter humi]MCQ8897698.1 hypothetical protein [Limnobacter humi]
MLNRAWMTVWLALVLGLAQQLAVTHVYQHNVDWAAGHLSQKDELHSAAKVCAKCLALADFQSAPPAHVHQLPPRVASAPQVHAQPVFSSARGRLFYRSRAPPALA